MFFCVPLGCEWLILAVIVSADRPLAGSPRKGLTVGEYLCFCQTQTAFGGGEEMENLPWSCISLILYLKLMPVGFYGLMLLLVPKFGLKFGSRQGLSSSFGCFNHAAMVSFTNGLPFHGFSVSRTMFLDQCNGIEQS